MAVRYRRPNQAKVFGQIGRLGGLGVAQSGNGALGFSTHGAAAFIKRISASGSCSMGMSGHVTNKKVAVEMAQVLIGQAGTRTTPPPPPPFTHVLLTRGYDMADGDAAAGTLYFTPSAWRRNQGITVVGATVSAVLDGEGLLSISLAANNDPATFPPATYYTVREEILGQPSRSYKVVVPFNAGPALDLSTLPTLP